MTDQPRKPRLRLLKLMVQPVLVWDDGETLIEQETGVKAVAPSDLDSLASGLRADIARLEGIGPTGVGTDPSSPRTA